MAYNSPKNHPRHILTGILTSLLMLLLLLLLAHFVLSHQFLPIDERLSLAVYAVRNPFLTQLMLFLTFMGGNLFLILGGFILGIYLLLKRSLYELILYILIFPLGYLLSLILKLVVGRARPDIDPLIHEVFYSFPSGHSMNSFLFYAMITIFVYWGTRNRRLSTITALLCASLIIGIGLSRVYLGVHYPSDVLGGWIAGIWWLVTVLVINQWLLKKGNVS